MGGILSKPKEPDLPPPEPPIGIPEEDEADILRRPSSTTGSSRGRTIGLAGALGPQNILKKRLLG